MLKLPRYNSIDPLIEPNAAMDAVLHAPLSGFLGGRLSGGRYVSHLEKLWCETFRCTHAIAVNSATSGLLAACHAIGVTNETVILSPYTMSATAATPVLLGANLEFVDIEPEHYCIDPALVTTAFRTGPKPVAVIATNLFGHPAELKKLARIAHANGAYLIEDNAQAPFATEDGSYAGTMGDIGVFSLNVHKHFQSGEGGIVVTDNDDFAHSIRLFINHGEMAGGPVGLNLRMTEATAAIAIVQLRRARQLVQSRIDLARRLIDGLADNPMIRINPPRQGCEHVYYALAMEVVQGVSRSKLTRALSILGVPLSEGYVEPLYRLPAFTNYATDCPVAEDMHKRSLALFETCAYDPSPEQIDKIIKAFDQLARMRTVA